MPPDHAVTRPGVNSLLDPLAHLIVSESGAPLGKEFLEMLDHEIDEPLALVAVQHVHLFLANSKHNYAPWPDSGPESGTTSLLISVPAQVNFSSASRFSPSIR